MKKLLLFLTILLTINMAYCGELQTQYEKQNAQRMKCYYDSYKNGSKYMYHLLNRLYELSDEANFQYLVQIKQCFKKKKHWEYIEVEDYTYKYLDDANRDMILFNNIVYSNQ